LKAAVFWHVRPCRLVDSYYIMEEPAAAVRTARWRQVDVPKL